MRGDRLQASPGAFATGAQRLLEVAKESLPSELRQGPMVMCGGGLHSSADFAWYFNMHKNERDKFITACRQGMNGYSTILASLSRNLHGAQQDVSQALQAQAHGLPPIDPDLTHPDAK